MAELDLASRMVQVGPVVRTKRRAFVCLWNQLLNSAQDLCLPGIKTGSI